MTDITFDTPRRRGTALVTGALLAPLFGAVVQGASRLFSSRASRSVPSRAARDAASVRTLAQRYSSSDRGFASDLYAAADRHEAAERARRPGSAADRRR